MANVVITGIGIVDCFGQDVWRSIESLQQNRSGLDRVVDDWAGCLPQMQCARAASISLQDVLPDRKQLKFMNHESRLAVAAAAQAVADGGLQEDQEKLKDVSLYVSTGLLSVDLDKVLPAVAASLDADGHLSMELLGTEGLRKVNPIIPFHLLANMPLCHVSIALGLTGANAAMYPGARDGWNLLRLAVGSIAAGRIDTALVGGSVHQSSLLPCGTLAGSSNGVHSPGDGAAFILMESAARAKDRSATVYCTLDDLINNAYPDAGPMNGSGALIRIDSTGTAMNVDASTGNLGAAAPAYMLALAASLSRSRNNEVTIKIADSHNGFSTSATLTPGNGVAPGIRVDSEDRRVVVTGVGVWSPIGTSWDSFREGLARGTSGVGLISNFDASSFPVRIAGEAPDVDFSAFNLDEPVRTALGRDRKSAFGLSAAHQAIGDAFPDGLNGSNPIAHRRASVMAAGLEVFHLEDLALTDDGDLDAEEMKRRYDSRQAGSFMQMPADLGARLANTLWGAEGPVLTNVSACAASTQAIGQAYEIVRDGIADAVLCGGYDSMINPLGVGGFSMLGALSERNDLLSKASRPFHRERDGFVLGEGAGALILEEMESALVRGAAIYGEVMGYATTLDSHHLTDPHPEGRGATEAFGRALSDAGIEPEEVHYINAHGTGTPKNDPVESAAIRNVWGKSAQDIPVSSTKSQIGHLISAAGAVEFLAGLQAFETDILPATINLDDIDPECALNHIAGSPLKRPVDVFVKSSFGFGGQNAVLVCRRWEGL
jgi:3-oxoacyl-[acyl-carrier-protein] synthase II